MRAPPPPVAERTLLLPRRDAGSELPPGQRLQEFRIEGVVGIGGYSVVYRALDTQLDRPVAIKEYTPAALATRDAGGRIVPRSPAHAQAFELGLASFLDEARLLASFDHPALVKVYRFWAEGGSAYMVMPLYRGITLRQWLASLGVPPSERWLRALTGELLAALATIHAARCYHRDIAPDNIRLLHDPLAAGYLEQRPRPLLLDFGAARRVIGEATQTLTAILKPGYSPIEQYGADAGPGRDTPAAGSLRHGPWTDLYALSAVLYGAIAGKPPPSAIARALRDEMVPAARVGAGRYGAALLQAIDRGLAVHPDERPESVGAFAALLDAPAGQTRVANPADRQRSNSAAQARGRPWYIGAALAVTLVLAAAGVAWTLR